MTATALPTLPQSVAAMARELHQLLVDLQDSPKWRRSVPRAEATNWSQRWLAFALRARQQAAARQQAVHKGG